MTQHTPGPWTFNERWGCVKTPSDDLLLVSGIAMPSGNHPKAREAEANARLIAAAPDLLAALTAVIEAEEDHDWSDSGISDALYEALERARAAIAKAKGGQR